MVATPGSVACGVGAPPCTIGTLPTMECCIGPPPFPTGCFPSFPGCVNGGGIPFACDDAADCSSGQVCCGTFNALDGFKCASSCASPSLQACRTHSECPSGECIPSAQVGYGVCR
jgi:hypothetical protein